MLISARSSADRAHPAKDEVPGSIPGERSKEEPLFPDHDQYRMSEIERAYQREVNQNHRERQNPDLRRQQRQAELEPTQQDIAYAAGFLDGEGYLGALRKGEYISTRVAVAQIVLPPLEFMRLRWGGTIGSHASYHVNRRPASNWVLSNKGLIEKLLLDVMPYLLVKRPAAESLLELTRLPKLVRDQPNLVVRAKREALYDELRRLNRRGTGEVG